jgi:hypothetical protein
LKIIYLAQRLLKFQQKLVREKATSNSIPGCTFAQLDRAEKDGTT